jgi:hypothetical protein
MKSEAGNRENEKVVRRRSSIISYFFKSQAIHCKSNSQEK